MRQHLWWRAWSEDPRVAELGPAMLHHAAELVALGGPLAEEPRAALLDAVLDTLVAQRTGSTRIPLSDAMANVARSGVAPNLVGVDEHAYTPLVATGGWLYQQRTLHYERELAQRLRARMDVELPRLERLADALADVVAHPTVDLSVEQRAAVELAASRPLAVITGGPGTGKTSIVVSLLRVLARCGVAPDRIALGAPTGKAANRLGESITRQLEGLAEPSELDERLRVEAPAPTTLHRLLRYSPTRGRFVRDEHDPIDADWVIVDEASMIDLVLMERLVRCVGDGARLVLLGDAEQLPSVEAGTVLRDLLVQEEHVARLEKSFRMDESDPAGRAILTLARAVRVGDTDAFDGVATTLVDVEPAAMRPRLLEFVDDWFRERIAAMPEFDSHCRRSYRIDAGTFAVEDEAMIARLFAHYEGFRILCLTHVFATGADALNTAFHLRMARRAGVEGIPDYLGGEPVMMLRNDYARGLFNGDQGLVLWIDTGEEVRLAAVFPHAGGYRAHHLSGLGGQLAHAWAMTVHKSQGSEFDDVTLVLPAEDIPLLSRELLYTAITRARRSVTVLGPAGNFALGASRAVERWSGLSDRFRTAG